MMDELQKYFELSETAQAMEHSLARFHIRKEAAALADRVGDVDLRFRSQVHLAHDALKASQFEDAFFAFVKFSAAFDQEPDRFRDYENFVLYFYGWSIGHICFYASVSREQIDQTLESYLRLLRERGANEGQYWMSVVEVGQHVGYSDDQIEDAYCRAFDARSTLPNRCDGCLLNFDVRFRTYRGEFDRARELASPAIDGTTVCESAPHVTYSYLVLPAYLQGDVRASDWFRAGYDLVRQDQGHISTICRHLEYVVAADRLDDAIALFDAHSAWAIDNRDDYDRLAFSTPAQILFEKLKNRGETIAVRTPSTWKHHQQDGVYSVETLRSAFCEDAQKAAESFDVRNGNRVISERLESTQAQLR